jgi:hypothetical protein
MMRYWQRSMGIKRAPDQYPAPAAVNARKAFRGGSFSFEHNEPNSRSW